MVKHELESSHTHPMEIDPPRNVEDDVAGKPFEYV